MRIPEKIFLLLSGAGLLALLLQSGACRREPVYIGSLEPPGGVDTTGNLHPCDPDSVYFSQQILPILTSNCAMSDCHDVASHEEGVILDNYINTRNTGQINLDNPAASKLYRVLNDPDPNDRMPPSPAPALPVEQRNLILQWIQQGALDLYCDAGCDTTQFTYSGGVQPIINLKCQGCHSGSNPSGGVALGTYSEVKMSVDNGSLMGSILHQTGFSPMPYPLGNSKLPDCEIAIFRKWIEAGALNN